MAKRKYDDPASVYAAEKAARLLIEESNADAVVILWTSQSKRSTKFCRHQYGNAILCNAMVSKACEDQEEAVDSIETEEDDE
jgi:hypothetical protein